MCFLFWWLFGDPEQPLDTARIDTARIDADRIDADRIVKALNAVRRNQEQQTQLLRQLLAVAKKSSNAKADIARLARCSGHYPNG